MKVSWFESKCKEKLLSEIVSNNTVDKEIDAGVQNYSKMGNMGQTFNPLFWKEWGLTLIAVDNILQMVKFPYIDDCSGSVAADKDYNNTQQDHEHVDLLPKFSL